ncbi:MAG: hypothetical protein HN413_11470 [Chloroflexi bacterium]|jgi:hypothetical protein|nr:hypothetical protein [Chloroflexota bacterium]
MKRFLPLLVLTLLACNVIAQLTDIPPTPLPPVEEFPAEPPAAAPQAEAEAPSVPPTIAPLPPTAEPPAANPLVPSGFLVSVGDGEMVNAYNAQGQMTGSLQTPGMQMYGSGTVHVAGSAPGGVVNVPVLFQAYDESGLIRMNLGGQVQTLVSDPELAYLVGARTQPIFAFTTIQWGGDVLVSHVYARSINSGGGAWALERVDAQSYAVQPLAVQASNDQPQGVWYSLMPYGIGGDIVFSPHKGLYYLDLTAGNTENLYLTDNFNPQGFSPDLTWIAYMPAENGFIEGNNVSLTLYNLYSTASVSIPLRPSSDRGAGNVVFAPENERVAWMEGSGWMMAETPNFHAKVLIADINGNLLAELEDTRFNHIPASGHVDWIQPVGWLDAETLIVEVRAEDWNDISLARVRYDGSEISFLAAGKFVGFLYP